MDQVHSCINSFTFYIDPGVYILQNDPAKGEGGIKNIWLEGKNVKIKRTENIFSIFTTLVKN